MPTLYDQFGHPIPSGSNRKPETREIAVANLRDRWGTNPSSGLTPQRLAAILKAADAGDTSRQAELFGEMEEKDAHLASQFQIRKLAVQGLDWEVLPGDDSRRAKKIAEFCAEHLDEHEGWDDALLDMLDALSKGYSLTEVLWDVSEGQAWIRDLRHVEAKKVTFWNSLTPRVLTEAAPAQGEDLPPWKFAYHRCKARSGYDTRAGIMRVCAWMYLFKNFAVKDWVGFSEVFGQPVRVGYYDQGASEADKTALLEAVRAIGTDAAGIISKSTEIKFLEASKTSSLNVYESLTRFADEQVSKAILGQTLTSGSGDGKGSYALGKVHNEVRQDLKEADAKALGRTITAQILRPLVGFNFGWDAPMPVFKFHAEPAEDLVELMKLYDLAAERMPISTVHMSERFNIPLAKEGEPLVWRKGQPAEPAAQESEALKQRLTLKAETPEGQANAGGHPVDAVAARLAEAAGIELGGWVDQVAGLLARVSSLEEFRDGLLGLFGELEPDELAESMAQALTLAELAGRFDA